ncbi:MAG: UDP-N-acetylmuramoyl-L-alanine--D-glutamate ligase [Clostridiales Family XIII bacterium]|jgi:UDP-N-acetylmuramoylalanine--D-glutamate ligase|nr:UDP-N-acetylmuramoyl-L-alanine--D-glutamate ligase [Clostridiales Family XIII bacterium]
MKSLFENKKILIFGLGKSGIAVLNALYNMGGIITVYDDKDLEWEDNKLFKKLQDLNVDTILNEDFLLDCDFDYLILSPGVSLEKKIIREAVKKGTKLLGELEVAYLFSKGKFIGITGTNGKTTTTKLTYEILKSHEKNVFIGGNIGKPILDMVKDAPKDSYFVTEVSSFQLETIDKFKPKISLLLNLTEDHMNRHKTMENYGNVKAKIFMNQRIGDFLIYNDEDERIKKLVQNANEDILKLPFSNEKVLKEGLFIRDNNIVLSPPFFDGKKKHKYFSENNEIEILDIKNIRLRGVHNLENILSAVFVNLSLEMPLEVIRKVVYEFKGVEHRLEEVREIDGIKFFNDSKGTNPVSSIKAISAIKENIRLILGGYDKDADFNVLIDEFYGRVKKVYILGATKEKIKKVLEKKNFKEYEILPNLKSCIISSYNDAKEGDNILFSPACASWDMYKSFEERGNEFKEIDYNLDGKK